MVTKEDTKRYSLDDLAERRTSGRTMTHADAPARAIDDDFWKGARIVMPCPKNKPLRQPT